MQRYSRLLLLVTLGLNGCGGGSDEDRRSDFARTVDLGPLSMMAVQDSGRIKSFESFARGTLRMVTGAKSIDGQENTFTYLDLIFRPQANFDKDIIYVKKKPIRERIIKALQEAPDVAQARLDSFMETGLTSLRLISHPRVLDLLEEMRKNLITTAKPTNAIYGALNWAKSDNLSFALRIIPTSSTGAEDEWHSVYRLVNAAGAPQDQAHAEMAPQLLEGLAAEQQEKLTSAWSAIAVNWQAQDAAAASTAITEFVGMLPGIAPDVYPDFNRLSWESWYFKSRNMTWVWMIYLLAIIPLLMSIIYRWRGATIVGVLMFLVAFGYHTGALLIRWHVAQRWPNTNMFEAVTTAAWLCGASTFVLEFLVRKTALRGLFFLASAIASMAALMAAYYMPIQLNPQIGNMMPVLHDIWLYIHTNVIIYSYGLIAMGATSGLLYLGYRVLGGDPAVAKTGGAGSLIMGGKGGAGFVLEKEKVTFGKVFDAATMVTMELSFILLWTGIVMGAIWADHSWGRPWGWDPKEVFALNTFVIFLLLVHVRFKVRDKGLWTAVLAVVGCVVMLFNWIVVNFVITGLHSYA